MRSRAEIELVERSRLIVEFAKLVIALFVGNEPNDTGLELEMHHNPGKAYGLYQDFCRRYGIQPIDPLNADLSGDSALFKQIFADWLAVNKCEVLASEFAGMKISGLGYDDDDGGSYVAIEIVYSGKIPFELVEALNKRGCRVIIYIG
jgi:hypothetical protein